MRGTLGTHVGLLARRSVRRTLRQPAVLAPTFVFPLVLLAVNSGGLDASTALPGFPADSYVDFAICVTFMQGALFAAITAGTEIAYDVETGFLSRLALTPLRRAAILIGQMAGAMVIALMGTTVYLLVGFASGVHVEAGAGGVVVLVVLSQLIALAFGSLGALMALRSGSGEAVQGLFPLLFVTFFLSSMNLPRELIEIDWFRTVATWNPVSYLVEAIRSLVVTGWDGTALARGFGAALAIGALGMATSAASLATRMTRT